MAGYYDTSGKYVSTHPADQSSRNMAAVDHATQWQGDEITAVWIDGQFVDITSDAYADWYAEHYGGEADG